MDFPINFIAATQDCCTFEHYVPAPCFRKEFVLNEAPASAELLICGLGFYELYLNGKKITKGKLAPYISAPDDLIYYDTYQVTNQLNDGKNVIGVILGNGMQNSFGGYIWDFDKAKWIGAPKLALRLRMTSASGEALCIESDESFRVSSSPIYFDELRCGEYYDARMEQCGWTKPEFDDSAWKTSIKAPSPKGEPCLCRAEPIVITNELKPVSIQESEGGYLYDFGVNCAGICRLRVNGAPGQKISMEHGERLENGKLDLKNIQFVPDGYVQKDIYICRGAKGETYEPSFTYHGFRYVLVKGITEEQAVPELLTYLVMNSDLKEAGGFECSDPIANTLQTMVRRSTLANFYYFPTDCPHREKNGWTADASLSAEHTLLNLRPENSYLEWLKNIRASQNEQGALPGIVPTAGWGFTWGNGPAWDSVLTNLPYYTYLYRGDKQILSENATAIFRYLNYISTCLNSSGLIELGLGDWCTPGREPDRPKVPLEFTDSVTCMDICEKSSFIFGELHMDLQQQFARELYRRLRRSVRERLIDFSTMTAAGNCQTAQAMAIYYNVFEPGEKQAAFAKLMDLISACNGHMDTGVLGARVIFHVLSDFGESELAYRMITRPDYPSYGNWVARGATSLWEDFQPEGSKALSRNHHFFGDISSWFIQCVAGIRLNPHRINSSEVDIRPNFINALNYAKAFHIAPAGKISVIWRRNDDGITLTTELPKEITGNITLPNGYVFQDNGLNTQPAKSGCYYIQNRLPQESSIIVE